jgi:DNA-directed RNA polymerase sigma subunit (sigma70/sigma32)
VDTDQEEKELSKSRRIDLGLAVLSVLREPGKLYSLAEIAAWCDCTHEAIRVIEEKAMKKLRRALKKQAPDLIECSK